MWKNKEVLGTCIERSPTHIAGQKDVRAEQKGNNIDLYLHEEVLEE